VDFSPVSANFSTDHPLMGPSIGLKYRPAHYVDGLAIALLANSPVAMDRESADTEEEGKGWLGDPTA
jgi:hypothetical protein